MVLHINKLLVQPVIGMDEPVKKKLKVEENEIDHDLEIFQGYLLQNCLCSVPSSTLHVIFYGFEETDLLWSSEINNRNRILSLISSIQLICDIAMKQNAKRFICSRIAGICDSLIHNENNLIDHLIEFANHPNQFICFAASRALSSFFLIVKSHIDQRWLDRLIENIVLATHQSKMSFSLDVIKRIIEWKDSEEHPLEDSDNYPPPVCHILSVEESDEIDTTYVKCLCVKSLELKWPEIVSRFGNLISSHCIIYQSAIITFLDLWEAIISVKANLSVIDTKPFYSNLDNFVSLLSSNIPPIIWKHMLNLFNEVLCYGSTLALQDVLAEEPCSLAHLVVRSVKDRNLLNKVPYREGSGRFGGGSGDGDKPLLQKVVLLVLKAVAVTVKETRCDSSSDSSLGSEAEDVDADMAVIERSIKEVLNQLDDCIKTLLPFHPETPLAQRLVQLFSDQDDALIESMVCCLDVTVGLCYRDSAASDLRVILSPGESFLQFLRTVSFDFDVLLDFLVSNETCFLLYLLRLLKYICRNWEEFLHKCGREIDDTMTVLIRLRIAVERLVSKDLFPYNINPVLRLLNKCEQLHEQSSL